MEVRRWQPQTRCRSGVGRHELTEALVNRSSLVAVPQGRTATSYLKQSEPPPFGHPSARRSGAFDSARTSASRPKLHAPECSLPAAIQLPPHWDPPYGSARTGGTRPAGPVAMGAIHQDHGYYCSPVMERLEDGDWLGPYLHNSGYCAVQRLSVVQPGLGSR